MRRLFFLLSIFLLFFILSQHSEATGVIHVNEAKTKLLFGKNASELSLFVDNQNGQSIAAKIQIEVIDTLNQVRVSASQNVNFAAGENKVIIPLTLFKENEKPAKDFLWYRLRYKIETNDAQALDGTLSFSEIAPDIFTLQATGSDLVYGGMRYNTHVRAFHPLTNKGFANIPITGEIKLTKDEDAEEENSPSQTLKAAGITDANGYATLNFTFPTDVNFDDADIVITGKRGEFTQTLTEDFSSNNPPVCVVQTDKPIYQPGQTLHIRTLIRKVVPDNFISNSEGTLKIEDPEGTLLFRTPLKTSRFGIASVDWKIPDNVRLGQYEITIDLKDNSYAGGRYFTISRYELPNFTVNVKPDRTYYTSNQNAKVEVRADYLFGQPVTKGSVRVVRETDRDWNYREQKWEITEEEVYEGKTDASGKFTANISLKEKHEELKENEYSRFRDYNYVAYFTDPTTNRTESRRFDLRITKQPIHIYFVGDTYNRSSRLPLEFYVSTFYADGKPAVCNVELSEVSEDKDEAKPVRLIQTVRTNRFGVAKISGLKYTPNGEDDLYLKLTARDAQNRVGFKTENIDFDDDPAIRVFTNKTIYRKGEPVRVEIVSSEKTGTVLIDVGRNFENYYSTKTQLRNGRAILTIPYQENFKGELSINAYSDFGKKDFEAGAHNIIYPSPRELKIKAETKQNSYRPGEEAKFDFSILTPNGKPIESALGVVVFDKAVTERARTDNPYRYNSGFLSGWLFEGDSTSLGVIRRRDVDYLDLSKLIPKDYELAVEAMLNQNDSGYVSEIGDEYEGKNYLDQSKVFGDMISLQLRQAAFAISSNYLRSGEYPKDENSLKTILAKHDASIDSLRDPWGIAYRPKFFVAADADIFELISAGADKTFETDDDFKVLRQSWNYYTSFGLKINSIVTDFHKRTGKYIRDKETFLTELQNAGINSNALIDRWGVPYYFEFTIDGNNYVIKILSSGADKKRAVRLYEFLSDDFIIWTTSINYFAETREAIRKALNKEFQETKRLPQNEGDLRKVLTKNGIDFDSLHDGWGDNYYVTFSTESRYTDRTITYNVKQDDGRTIQRTGVVPVTQEVAHVIVRSAGADGKQGTQDDFNAEVFSNVVSEKSREDLTKNVEPVQKPLPQYRAILSADKGAIEGTVTDLNGAMISGAIIAAKNTSTNIETTATTDSDGRFLINDLLPGTYEVKATASGFKAAIMTSIEVKTANITQIKITLEPGQAAETVNVSSSAPDVSTTVSQSQISELPINGRKSLDLVKIKPRIGDYGNVIVVTKSGSSSSTPRLREYFPETLFWQPELITDAQGRAQIVVRLADNITTWNLAVVGTTPDGQVGTTQKEILAFQPFFVDHDPPKNLTVGDEISLPVVLRNYTATKQSVTVDMKPESWFSLLSSPNQKAFVNAGDSNKVLFPFRAVQFGKNLKQRVTAQGVDANDAIEKTIDVSPYGQQIVDTAGGILNDSLTLETNIPNDAIAKTQRTELKIYPSLMAHVLESVEAIMSRPYGCAEQTISSAYPSLLILKAHKQGDKIPDDVIAKARKFARAGYERLIGYKTEEGGFTYWGRGNADAALTAYALRFLIEAKDVIETDEDVLENTRQWFIKNQDKDGSWKTATYGYEILKRRELLTNAYITRVLASSTQIKFNDEKYSKEKADALNASIKRALSFLRPKVEEFDEPYLIATYALAANSANEKDETARAAARLEKLVRNEAIGSYWNLETNTPFYGWGLAGRIETTAIVLQALSQKSVPPAPTGVSSNDELINRGLLFLLKQKDRYGVWYSTQATINVLDTLIALLSFEKNESSNQAEIFVDGKLVTTLKLPPSNEPSAQITVDLSNFINTGAHRVEIKRGDKSSASVQLITSYYLPWKQNNVSQSSSNDLRFKVAYDKTETKIGDEINVSVEAQRVAFKGYGMMLAEIGLPPGADVDRASLDKAVAESGWSFSYYDVLPDRIIAYLWSTAGGVKFNFNFKPRYGIKAQTAPSQLYDYYNPEANVAIAPTLFNVR